MTLLSPSPCEERLVKEHIPRVSSFLSKRDLNISEKKSKIRNLENEGFTFLGWDITLKSRSLKRNKSKTNKKVLIIRPSKKSIKSFKREIKDKFRSNKPIRALISDLNPVLRGLDELLSRLLPFSGSFSINWSLYSPTLVEMGSKETSEQK